MAEAAVRPSNTAYTPKNRCQVSEGIDFPAHWSRKVRGRPLSTNRAPTSSFAVCWRRIDTDGSADSARGVPPTHVASKTTLIVPGSILMHFAPRGHEKGLRRPAPQPRELRFVDSGLRASLPFSGFLSLFRPLSIRPHCDRS